MLTAFLYTPEKRGGKAADGDSRWKEFALCTFWMQRLIFSSKNVSSSCQLLTWSLKHLVIFVHVHKVICTVHIDVLDPDVFDKCSRFVVKHHGPSWADSRRTSDASLSLLCSSLLQTATNPHRHNLRISIIKLYDERMILKIKERGVLIEKMFDKLEILGLQLTVNCFHNWLICQLFFPSHWWMAENGEKCKRQFSYVQLKKFSHLCPSKDFTWIIKFWIWKMKNKHLNKKWIANPETHMQRPCFL